MINIRKTTAEDIPRVLEILAYARDFMRASGNPNQWQDNRPDPGLVYEDVEKDQGYVMEDDGWIFGTFALVMGDDPTYAHIEDGEWPDNDPYGTIHRIAGDDTHKGVFEKCLEFCDTQTDIVRIDTHIDNKPMLHLLEKTGFVRCGVIYVDNGTPREAFYRRK